jgi:cell division protein FtsA
MPADDVIVGLDIGTTKIAAVVAEITEDERPKIVGLGIHPADGLKKGMVANLEQAVESVIRAVQDAELMAGVKVEKVFAGISGSHIRGISSRGIISLAKSSKEIGQADVDKVIEAAKAVALPLDREIIHAIPQEFSVDDQSGIKDPMGMSGTRLEADVYIITGSVTSAQNIHKSLQRAGLEVLDLVLQPLASSYALLTPEEEESGVVLIELGGGITDMALFYDGSLRYTATIGLGGRNITNDIAIGLKTSVDKAEELKRNYGCALNGLVDSDETISVPGLGSKEPKEISRAVLSAIIEPRVEEIFNLVLKEMRKSDHAELVTSGIVLTGGGALLEGTQELAEQVFDLPVRVGSPDGVIGIEDVVSNPIHATGVGLILYGLSHPQGRRNEKNRGKFRKVYRKIKNLFGEYS